MALGAHAVPPRLAGAPRRAGHDAAGTSIALPCVWALGRLVESQLYDVKPTDPATIAAATVLLGGASLGAALIPARRASAVNPTDALRCE